MLMKSIIGYGSLTQTFTWYKGKASIDLHTTIPQTIQAADFYPRTPPVPYSEEKHDSSAIIAIPACSLLTPVERPEPW